jgi:hypothetical protein
VPLTVIWCAPTTAWSVVSTCSATGDSLAAVIDELLPPQPANSMTPPIGASRAPHMGAESIPRRHGGVVFPSLQLMATERRGSLNMKSSQLARLRELGELREKELLTEEEFNEQKTALMGTQAVSSSTESGRGTRWLGRVAVLLSLALASVALYVALDARSKTSTDAALLRHDQATVAHPKLVVEKVSTDTQSLPDDGYRHNFTASCHYPSIVLGGGFAEGITSGPPTLLASYPEVNGWQIGAASESGTRHLSVSAMCAHGAGGLTIEQPTP